MVTPPSSLSVSDPRWPMSDFFLFRGNHFVSRILLVGLQWWCPAVVVVRGSGCFLLSCKRRKGGDIFVSGEFFFAEGIYFPTCLFVVTQWKKKEGKKLFISPSFERTKEEIGGVFT